MNASDARPARDRVASGAATISATVRVPAHRRAPRGARRRARARRGAQPTTCSTSRASCSRCRRSAPSWPRIDRELIDGRGVVLIRGVPVDRYGKERASSIYWGIGMHLGSPWPQNAKGHLLGDVTDQGKARQRPDVARQRDRRHRVPVPLRRLRPRRPVLPRRRRERWRERRGQRRHDPQRAGAHRARARGRALRAVPVRPARRAGARARSPGTRCRSSTAAATGSSCATSGRTSRRRAATTTRPGRRRRRGRR